MWAQALGGSSPSSRIVGATVHDARTVAAALRLGEAGLSATEVGRMLGLPRATVRDWLAGLGPGRTARTTCPRCGVVHDPFELSRSYVYLLGLYLGDGCVSAHPRGVFRLRIVLDLRYPDIIRQAAEAMAEVNRRAARVGRRIENCVEVSAYSKGWPCIFPQHGQGMKHHRRIALAHWQAELVTRYPEHVLRGLIHSDGCRFISTGRNWSWPRYAFSNRSADIHAIFRGACELLDVHWTAAGAYTTYVSRKADVAVLDDFIGPKR